MIGKFTLAILILLSSIISYAQDVTVSGRVTNNNGNPVVGAMVVENNTTNAVRTDVDGNYKLTIPGDRIPATIVVRSIGLGFRDFKVDGSTTEVSFNPVMGQVTTNLNEVVVAVSKKYEKVLNSPASVSVLSETRIQDNTALSVTDNIRKVAAVDVMPTGLVSNNVNVRGFNGIFSGSMLYMVDNRVASVPSLRVNAFQLVPTSNADLASMEVVRGPASALYGPFASNGVFAIYTKSPLDMENRMEITLGLTSGLRAGDEDMPKYNFVANNNLENTGILNPEIRIAGKISNRLGVKVSASYLSANDFAYFDDREPNGKTVRFGNQSYGKPWASDGTAPQVFNRDFKIRKFAADGRIDWQVSDILKINFTSGYSKNTNMELTGLGAAQAKDWVSLYFQTRLTMKRFFMQYYINSTNSGNTYLIPQTPTQTTFTYLKETSNFQSFQIQNSNELFKKFLDLTYGFDFYTTRPSGNVYGRFDQNANINQYGVYGQGMMKFNSKLTGILAMRFDYQDVIKEWMFSPRAGLIYKPKDNHTIRLTYNRAFQAPSALNFFLDINNGTLNPLTGASIRAFGNSTGINYNRGADGLPLVYTASGQALPYTSASNSALAPSVFSGISKVIASQLIAQGVPQGSALQSAALLTSGFTGATLAPVDLNAGSSVDVKNITNRGSVESTINQTFELGYKGLVMDKLSLGVDLYYTHIKNFVSPLTNATYQVGIDPSYYSTPAAQAQMLANINNAGPYKALLIQALTGSATATNAEIIKAYTTQLIRSSAVANIGTIAPSNTNTGQDMILTYYNLGEVSVFGSDLGFNYMATKFFNIEGAFSFVNKDRFEVPGATGGYVSLNAPKYKSALNFEFKLPVDHHNLMLKLGWRWMDAFDGNSAVYIGRVNAANLLDAGMTWRPSKSPSTVISLNVNNLLNYRHQFFPGTPAMGTVALLKLQHTFGVK